MMGHKIANHLLHRRTLDIKFCQVTEGRSLSRTYIGLLIGHKFSIDNYSMLEVIYPKRCGFAEAYGAKMARNLNPAFVCCLGRSAKFSARNVHISFEGRKALVRPLVYHLASVIRSGKDMKLRCKASLAIQIWTGKIHLWPWCLSGINQLFQIQVGVRLDTSGRS